MSGIAGFTGRSSFDDVHRFQDALIHRGPDEQGFFRHEGIALSHSRLSTFDLATGRQPIFNEDSTCAIVLDGNIYNHRELREDLKRRHRFVTATDAEAVLHLYEEKGTSASEYLKGEFAFCIWDSRQRTCFLSHDQLGVKPLFYSITPVGDLVFCSELRTLLLHRGVQDDLDVDAIAEYFTCLYVSGNRTVLKSIRKLQPGESLLWKSGVGRTWKYWTIPEPAAQVTRRAEELNERVRGLLNVAVKRRLTADVPVGAFLTGGLDSSLTVALASEECRRLHTFSIAHGESDFDEFHRARLVAERYGTTHHEFVVLPRADEVIDALIDSIDEPVADPSAITTFLISRKTRDLVKVVLWGIGGDEMLLSDPHLDGKFSQWLPGVFRRPLASATWLWPSRLSSFLDPDARKRLSPDFGFIPSGLLQLCDNMTMAHSLEARLPFCDVDLVDEIARTRATPVLRHIAKRYLPEKVVNRTKREFGVPIARWFRNELKDYVESQFTHSRLPAVVDFASVRRMWDEHKSGRADHTHALWAVLLLTHWLGKISGKHVFTAG